VDHYGGYVENAVAHGLGLSLGQCTVETCHLAPGQECAGDHRDRHPGFVGAEAVEGQVGKSACFPASHPVFDAGMAAVTQFEGGDVVTLRVGDEAGVAPPGAGVEERELGARSATVGT
jgi:hypothetical protein